MKFVLAFASLFFIFVNSHADEKYYREFYEKNRSLIEETVQLALKIEFKAPFANGTPLQAGECRDLMKEIGVKGDVCADTYSSSRFEAIRGEFKTTFGQSFDLIVTGKDQVYLIASFIDTKSSRVVGQEEFYNVTSQHTAIEYRPEGNVVKSVSGAKEFGKTRTFVAARVASSGITVSRLFPDDSTPLLTGIDFLDPNQGKVHIAAREDQGEMQCFVYSISKGRNTKYFPNRKAYSKCEKYGTLRTL